MDLLVTYDIDTTTPQGEKRLRKVAKTCEGVGSRVQKSVFEIACSDIDLVNITTRLSKLIDPSRDSVRFYTMPTGTFTTATHVGIATRPEHRTDPIL